MMFRTVTRDRRTRAVLRRVLSPTMRSVLAARGLVEDLRQEVALAEFVARDYDDISFMRAMNKAIYRFLRNEGFRRVGSSFDDPTYPASIAVHLSSIAERDRLLLHDLRKEGVL